MAPNIVFCAPNTVWRRRSLFGVTRTEFGAADLSLASPNTVWRTPKCVRHTPKCVWRCQSVFAARQTVFGRAKAASTSPDLLASTHDRCWRPGIEAWRRSTQAWPRSGLSSADDLLMPRQERVTIVQGDSLMVIGCCGRPVLQAPARPGLRRPHYFSASSFSTTKESMIRSTRFWTFTYSAF